MADLTKARTEAYHLRQQINLLQAQINEETNGAALEKLLAESTQLQEKLQELENDIAEGISASDDGLIAKAATPGRVTRSAGSKTAPPISSTLKMQYLPTAIYHLLDVEENPLVEYLARQGTTASAQYRITSVIENYSAEAITTFTLEKNEIKTIRHLPTLFPEQIDTISELTRATLTIKVEELSSTGTSKILIHETRSIWLLSRNSAPLEVRDPSSGTIVDLSRYLGAFVTPNAAIVFKFLRTVAKHHPDGRLYGYQQDVLPQVKAIFDALKVDSQITYINSVVTFNPEQNASTQRVRLPRQCLDEQSANCIDGTLLFASLLEAASLNPALVIVPGHALVGWQNQADGDDWSYLETTMIGTNSFDEALDIGNRKAKTFSAIAAKNPQQSPSAFRRWSLRELRTKFQITPLE